MFEIKGESVPAEEALLLDSNASTSLSFSRHVFFISFLPLNFNHWFEPGMLERKGKRMGMRATVVRAGSILGRKSFCGELS